MVILVYNSFQDVFEADIEIIYEIFDLTDVVFQSNDRTQLLFELNFKLFFLFILL